MNFFLNFFPDYRRMAAEVERLNAEKLRMQDQVALMQQDNTWFRSLAEKCIEQEREARKIMANAWMQTQYGMKPYPEAPGIPETMTERSDPGAIKRNDHWLAQMNHGRQQSEDAYKAWENKWKAALEQAKARVYPEAMPDGGFKEPEPMEMVAE